MVARSKKCDPRDIVVKVLLNSDEFAAFNESIKEVGGNQSCIGRQLFMQFVHAVNSRRDRLVQEWAGIGQVMAIPSSFGSRLHYGAAPAHLSP